MTKESGFKERMDDIDSGEFHKFTPTKEDREHAEALMKKLFTTLNITTHSRTLSKNVVSHPRMMSNNDANNATHLHMWLVCFTPIL